MQSSKQTLNVTKKTVFTFGAKKGASVKSSGTTTVVTIPTFACPTATCP